MKRTILEILKNYHQFALSPKRISLLNGGLVNKNFLIEARNGEKYVLQNMSKVFNLNTILNTYDVADFLRKNNIDSPLILKNKKNKLWTKGKDNSLWKLYKMIDGQIFEIIKNKQIAFEAGQVLGEFLSIMKRFSRKRLKQSFLLHQSKKIFKDFKTIESDFNQITNRKDLSDYILNHFKIFLLPKDLPKQVVHGDPKISNIIFRNKKGVCLIDLDTCMVHSPLVDIGDALRSWCSLEEDNPNNKFLVDNFNFAVKGIESRFKLSSKEKGLIIQAVKLITIELATRFAIDVVRNNYFGFDKIKYKNRRDHNLARVIGQIRLVKEIEKIKGIS